MCCYILTTLSKIWLSEIVRLVKSGYQNMSIKEYMKQLKFKHNPNSFYYKRAKNQIDELKKNLDFLIEMKICYALRKKPSVLGMTYEDGIKLIQEKYVILPSVWPVIYPYAIGKTKKVKYDDIIPPVKLYSSNNKLLLEVSHFANKQELQNFVKDFFESDFVPVFTKNPEYKKPVKPRKSKDIYIKNYVYDLHSNGYTPKQIRELTELGVDEITNYLDNRRRLFLQ